MSRTLAALAALALVSKKLIDDAMEDNVSLKQQREELDA